MSNILEILRKQSEISMHVADELTAEGDSAKDALLGTIISAQSVILMNQSFLMTAIGTSFEMCKMTDHVMKESFKDVIGRLGGKSKKSNPSAYVRCDGCGDYEQQKDMYVTDEHTVCAACHQVGEQ